jgi:hypothetical protein
MNLRLPSGSLIFSCLGETDLVGGTWPASVVCDIMPLFVVWIKASIFSICDKQWTIALHLA